MTASRPIIAAAALLLLGSSAAMLLQPSAPKVDGLALRGRSARSASGATVPQPFTYTVRFVPAPPGELDAPTGTPILKRVLLAWSSWPAPVTVQRRDELSDWTTLLTVAESTAISLGLCVDDTENQWRATP